MDGPVGESIGYSTPWRVDLFRIDTYCEEQYYASDFVRFNAGWNYFCAHWLPKHQWQFICKRQCKHRFLCPAQKHVQSQPQQPAATGSRTGLPGPRLCCWPCIHCTCGCSRLCISNLLCPSNLRSPGSHGYFRRGMPSRLHACFRTSVPSRLHACSARLIQIAQVTFWF